MIWWNGNLKSCPANTNTNTIKTICKYYKFAFSFLVFAWNESQMGLNEWGGYSMGMFVFVFTYQYFLEKIFVFPLRYICICMNIKDVCAWGERCGWSRHGEAIWPDPHSSLVRIRTIQCKRYTANTNTNSWKYEIEKKIFLQSRSWPAVVWQGQVLQWDCREGTLLTGTINNKILCWSKNITDKGHQNDLLDIL